jgi:hypothetical protein
MSDGILGSHFRLTEIAATYLAKKSKETIDKNKMEGFFPLISWLTIDESRENFIPGPILAFDNSTIFKEYYKNYYIFGDFEILIALDEQKKMNLKIKY